MNKLILFNENTHPESWRINDPSCTLSTSKKKELIFFDKEHSKKLWHNCISKKYTHLLLLNESQIKIRHSETLDFTNPKKGELFFKNHLKNATLVIFFWGPLCSCLAPAKTVSKHWNDFFLPSDENSITYIPNTNKIIFSFEERFFAGTIKK
ncbi:hypothetical protein [Chitinilyticum litopenaei]|uniref:hypothetical protein n=1 Tax=Chitinilyticum litopenaei TaxID=1121276 RepID=UPI001185AA0E|nr:hypothetical protein [Chitinilyticum litopenaei]